MMLDPFQQDAEDEITYNHAILPLWSYVDEKTLNTVSVNLSNFRVIPGNHYLYVVHTIVLCTRLTKWTMRSSWSGEVCTPGLGETSLDTARFTVFSGI